MRYVSQNSQQSHTQLPTLAQAQRICNYAPSPGLSHAVPPLVLLPTNVLLSYPCYPYHAPHQLATVAAAHAAAMTGMTAAARPSSAVGATTGCGGITPS